MHGACLQLLESQKQTQAQKYHPLLHPRHSPEDRVLNKRDVMHMNMYAMMRQKVQM